MKISSLPAAAVAALFSCVLFRPSVAPARLDVHDEVIYVAPIVNGSGIPDPVKRPPDSPEGAALARHIDRLHERLAAEIGRCRKYGHYTVSTVPAAASVRLSLTLEKHELKGDTLLIPATVRVRETSGELLYEERLDAGAVYRARSAPSSEFHLVGKLLSDYVNRFPCERIGALLYPGKQ